MGQSGIAAYWSLGVRWEGVRLLFGPQLGLGTHNHVATPKGTGIPGEPLQPGPKLRSAAEEHRVRRIEQDARLGLELGQRSQHPLLPVSSLPGPLAGWSQVSDAHWDAQGCGASIQEFGRQDGLKAAPP